MKPEKKLIKEVTTKNSKYSMKAKVIEKTTVYASAENSTLLYQIITFQDEEGTKMKTILYDEEIEVFDDVIQERMEYEISNAKLKIIPGQFQGAPSDQIYEIEFNSNTTVQPVFETTTSGGPSYLLIAAIPRSIFINDRYDVLGIVVYVEQNCQITKASGHVLDMHDAIIVDQSSEQVMIVEAWADLAIEDCETLHSIATSFPVVGFTALRPSFRRGFSLSTTPISFIIFNPPGEMADALRTWGEANHPLLETRNHQICEVRNRVAQRIIFTIDQLLQKRVNNTLQEETHWLRVQLSEFGHSDVHYSSCGAHNSEAFGDAYACIACIKENVISTPRMIVTFEATDGTGAWTFTAFTANAERLLEIEAITLYTMPAQGREDFLLHIEAKRRNNPVYIQVVPAPALSRTQELKWVLQDVAMI